MARADAKSFLMMVLAVLLLAVTTITWAQDPGAEVVVDPPARPVEVVAGIYIVDLVRIDGAEQLFTADVVARFRWHDPRLADPEGRARKLPLDQVWNPKVTLVNLREVSTLMPKVVEVSADGTVDFVQRVVGDFAAPLDLQDFPLDSQTLFMRVVAVNQSPEEIRFVIDDTRTGRSERLTIADWSVGPLVARTKPFSVPPSDRQLASFIVELQVERLVAYYVKKIISSVSIIVAMAWLVFWIDTRETNPRVSVSVTSMLTLIAYRFLVGQDLPRLPYLTRMDSFLLGSTSLLFAGLAAVVVVSRLHSGGKENLARKVNNVSRWVFLALFVAVLGTVFWPF